jgi:hypothetical protein
MTRRRRKTLVSLAVAFVVLGAAFDLLLLLAWGARAPGWSHWLCSPAFHTSAHHRGQPVGDGLAATLLSSAKALAPHWPHILPIAIALATLVYLRRANARYHAGEDRLRASS